MELTITIKCEEGGSISTEEEQSYGNTVAKRIKAHVESEGYNDVSVTVHRKYITQMQIGRTD